MKKLISLSLAAALCISLAGCGSSGSSGSAASTTAAAAAGTEAAGEAAGDGAELAVEDVWAKGSTVTFHVPAKAGGGTDLYCRYLTQALTELYPDVNFIVQNYDTVEVGREAAKNADPDGLNLAVHHGGWILEYLAGSTNVNPKDDLKVVGILNQGGPQAIIAKPDAPYHNFKELGDYIAANPGEVVIGCSLGGASQGAIYKIIEALGEGYSEQVNWVQCASEADKLTQTASGSIDIANCSVPNAQSYEADGRLIILGSSAPSVATLDSMEELVGLELGDSFKTTAEQGLENGEWDSCYYCWAPAGTPDNICKAINEAIMKACEVQSYIDGNKQMASYTDALDLDTCRDTFQKEWDSMDAVAAGMGVKTR